MITDRCSDSIGVGSRRKLDCIHYLQRVAQAFLVKECFSAYSRHIAEISSWAWLKYFTLVRNLAEARPSNFSPTKCNDQWPSRISIGMVGNPCCVPHFDLDETWIITWCLKLNLESYRHRWLYYFGVLK